jgi:peptidyl-prolyl cis-trans isomerase SurA
MKQLLRPILVAVFVASLSYFAAAQQVVEEIVARVNDEIITRTDLNRAKEQLAAEVKQQGGTDEDVQKRQKDLLRDLIDQRLLVQAGKDAGVNVENELIKRLDEMRKQFNFESMEDLEKEAEKQGISFEDYKDQMRRSMITQQVIQSEVGRKMNITPNDVKAYYEQHKKEFEQPEQVDLAEILVSTETPHKDGEAAPPEDPARVAAAEAKANEILKQLKAGAKFDELAKKESQGPTAAEGGELGAFKKGMLAPQLEEKVFAMKTGEITDVIRTRQGFIILKVNQHMAAGIPAQKDIENNIYEAIYYQRLQPALRAFLTKAREEAYIDIKQGYVDTGASPNQTKPLIVSAEDPNAPAKKPGKRKKKLGIF